jgi:broad-specificity NMP kinase
MSFREMPELLGTGTPGGKSTLCTRVELDVQVAYTFQHKI